MASPIPTGKASPARCAACRSAGSPTEPCWAPGSGSTAPGRHGRSGTRTPPACSPCACSTHDRATAAPPGTTAARYPPPRTWAPRPARCRYSICRTACVHSPTRSGRSGTTHGRPRRRPTCGCRTTAAPPGPSTSPWRVTSQAGATTGTSASPHTPRRAAWWRPSGRTIPVWAARWTCTSVGARPTGAPGASPPRPGSTVSTRNRWRSAATGCWRCSRFGHGVRATKPGSWWRRARTSGVRGRRSGARWCIGAITAGKQARQAGVR